MSPATEALAGFLGAVDFTHFCTFTTRKPISVNSARRIAENVKKFVGAGKQSTMFWAAEKFDTREGFHFHALLQTHYHPIEIFDWYHEKYGRCQIINNTEPDVRQSAAFYCSKYITKELADYDIYFSDRIRNRAQLSLHRNLDQYDKFLE